MRRKSPAVIAAIAALSLGAAACGSDEESTSSSSGSSSSQKAAPKPVAQIDQLSGKSTAVALDAGFVAALELSLIHISEPTRPY